MPMKKKLQASFPKNVHFPEKLGVFCDWVEAQNDSYEIWDWKLIVDTDHYYLKRCLAESSLQDFGVFMVDATGSVLAVWQPEGCPPKIVLMGSEGNYEIVADSFDHCLYFLRDRVVELLEEEGILPIEGEEEDFEDDEFDEFRGDPAEYAVELLFLDWLSASFPEDQMTPSGHNTDENLRFRQYVVAHLPAEWEWGEEDIQDFLQKRKG